MKRSVILILAWLAASGVLFTALSVLDADWNFFSWNLEWDRTALLCGVGAVGALAAFWLLARARADRPSQIASLIICLLLFGFAVLAFPAEPVQGPPGGLLNRTEASPLLYRGARTLLFSLPTVFWFYGPYRAWRRRA